MSIERSLEILKEALLLEKRGKSFYSRVAEHTQHNSVREFFSLMAEEEQGHIEILHGQYKALKDSGKFSANSFSTDSDPLKTASEVIDSEIARLISGADYESAAISAAISMEEKAIKVYSERAESASDDEERTLYRWLADWERNHLHRLLEIDRNVTEKIWLDNSFWPF